MNKRPDILNGPTYELSFDDNRVMFLTINENNGKPFEVFMRMDDPVLHEWIHATMILISWLLRDGKPLIDIANELEKLHGPASRHMIPGTNIQSPSLVARVGRALRLHAEKKGEILS